MTTIAQFTRTLLACKGALVEPEGDGLIVVAGAELAASLGLAEYQRLRFEPTPGDPHAIRVDYDAPILERLGRLVDEMGRLAVAAPPPMELKPIDPEAELDRALTVANGVYRFRESGVAQAAYVGYVIEYDMLADERTSGLVDVWVNPATRSIARMSSLVEGLARDDEGAPPAGVEAMVRAAWRLAAPAATSALQARLEEFTDSLTRRRDRDLRRLRDYHLSIDQEIRRKLGRLPASDEAARQRELMRLEATARSYQARVTDLADRYRVRVRLSPLAALVCTLPTYRLSVRLLRRTTSTDTAFTWNPIDRRLETRACDGCNRPVSAAALCDDRVHYLCADCLSPCPHCGRPFCRACHARCPRRH
jgi:hypothetical protein